MKMGTTRSPCSYDAAASHAVQSATQRRPPAGSYGVSVPLDDAVDDVKFTAS